MPKSLASLLPATPPALCIVDFIRAREAAHRWPLPYSVANGLILLYLLYTFNL